MSHCAREDFWPNLGGGTIGGHDGRGYGMGGGTISGGGEEHYIGYGPGWGNMYGGGVSNTPDLCVYLDVDVEEP